MKDIKLITAIISAIALGACTGGSGDGGFSPISAPTNPSITTPTNQFSGLDTDPTVNSENTSLTSMASYTVTNEGAVNNAMYTYVHDRLPGFGTRGGAQTQRGASTRGLLRDNPPPSAEDIAAAIAKINEMKGVLLDLTSSNVDLETYITNNRQLVAETLRLYGDDIDVANATVQDLIDAFNTHDFSDVNAAFASFDNSHNFVFETDSLNDVDFKLVGGDDMIIRFVLDENGRITQAGGGSIGENGFEISEEFGWFDRAPGNVDTFSAMWEKYTISLSDALHSLTYETGEHAGEPLALAISFDTYGGGNGIMNPKFTRPSVVGDTDDIREELIKQFNAEVDKFINSQPSDTPEAQIAQLRADAAMLLNATLNNDTWWNAHTGDINHTQSDVHIAFTGVGKDVNVGDKKLKYSDFGYVTMNENNQLDYQPYIGGYASRKVTTVPESTITYKGTAIAGLSATGATPRVLRDDGAILTHAADTGLSTLTMDNLQYQNDAGETKDWYNMEVTMLDGEALAFDFDRGVGTSNEKTIEADYRFHYNPGQLVADFFDPNNDVHMDEGQYVYGEGDISYRGSGEANYYGEDGVESEATVGFNFTEDYHPVGEDEHEVSIYGAFGGVEYTAPSGN